MFLAALFSGSDTGLAELGELQRCMSLVGSDLLFKLTTSVSGSLSDCYGRRYRSYVGIGPTHKRPHEYGIWLCLFSQR